MKENGLLTDCPVRGRLNFKREVFHASNSDCDFGLVRVFFRA